MVKTTKPTSIATKPPKQRLNTDKFSGEKFTENTELKVTTCGATNKAIPYDEIKESGVQYSHPEWNETTIDRSDRLPNWTSIKGYSLDDKDAQGDQAPINYGKDIGLTEGFHKQPDTHIHSMDEMTQIRKMHLEGGKDNLYTPQPNSAV